MRKRRKEELNKSGNQWLLDIPEEWEEKKIKYILSTPITDGPHETPELIDEGVPFISAEAIKNKKIDFSKRRGFISETDHRKFSLKCKPEYGDIFLVKSGATTGNVARVETEKEFSIWSPLAMIRANEKKMDSKLLFYCLQSDQFKKSIEYNWSFGTQQNIGMGVISNLSVAVPKNRDEQKVIVNFLDHKTKTIDQLIEKKQQLIEKLKEKRQAFITKAVTKGLNPDAPMEESGIEWLGKIPKHWDVTTLRHLSKKITDGSHHSPPTVDKGLPYVTVKDVRNNKVDTDNAKKISKIDYIELERNGCRPKKGDILITKDGTIGRGAVIHDNNEFVVLSSLGIIRPDHEKHDSNYIKEFLTSDLGVQQMLSFIAGAALRRITISIINELLIPVPPLSEQRIISKKVKDINIKFFSITEKILDQINKLQEYRQSLISAAVTGKIDVRDELPELAE